jgi:hypothetical protein
MEVLVNVQIATAPGTIVNEEPLTAPPVQFALTEYPLGPVSDTAYVPAWTVTFVTALVPATPEMVVGPVAVRVQSVGIAVPPLILFTTLRRVSVAGREEFMIVQVATALGPKVNWLPLKLPPTQVHALAV